MNVWEERAARNEALFREVNEGIERLHGRESTGASADFICECADDTCTTFVSVPLQTYERVRSDPRQFLVKPGHEKPQLEEIVEEEPQFLIVSKKAPAAARIAEETDPR